MRAVLLEVPAEWLEERRRLGHDRWDEMWEGVLHMVPPPNFLHQKIGSKLIAFLDPLLEPRGIGVQYETGVFRPGAGGKDHRQPDLTFFPLDQPGLVTEHGFEGGPTAVVEIRSPNDETYEKLHFYASLGVQEIIVIDPEPRTVEVYRLAGTRYLATSADESGRLHAASIDVHFSTLTGDEPKLRVECSGRAREI